MEIMSFKQFRQLPFNVVNIVRKNTSATSSLQHLALPGSLAVWSANRALQMKSLCVNTEQLQKRKYFPAIFRIAFNISDSDRKPLPGLIPSADSLVLWAMK